MSPATKASYASWLMSDMFQPTAKEHRRLGSSVRSLLRVKLEHTSCVPATDDLSVQLVTAGSLDVVSDYGAGRFSKVMRPGDFGLAPSGVDLRNEGAGRSEFIILALPNAELQRSAECAGVKGPVDFRAMHGQVNRDPKVSTLLTWLWEDAEEDTCDGNLFTEQLLDTLILRLCNLASTPIYIPQGGLAPWQVKCIVDHLEDRLADDVSLNDIAALVGLSNYHVCRAFKQSTGVPPYRYRLQRRIERARDMLERTDLPVAEVAAAVGYDDPSQLAAAFRKALGVSPTQYRRERRS